MAYFSMEIALESAIPTYAGGLGTGWNWRLFDYLIGEPAHFIMERRMLLGIKRQVGSGSSTDDEELGG